MISARRGFARNVAWNYLAEILPRAVALLITPLWSTRVSPEDYGRWVLILTSVDFLLSLSGLGLSNFHTKILYRFHDERADKYFGMTATAMVVFSVAVGLVLAVGSPWFTRTILGPNARPDLFVYIGIQVVLTQFSALTVHYLQCQVNYNAFFLQTFLRWSLGTGLMLFFLLVLHQGFYSWLWAALAAETVVLPVSLLQLRRVRWTYWNKRVFRFSVKMGFPSLATGLVGLGQTRLGRYAVSMSGLGAGVGLLGAAQSFAGNAAALMRPAKVVALRIVGHALEQEADSPLFMEFFHFFSFFALAATFLAALFFGNILRWFVAPAYHSATAALPFLVFGLYLEEIYSLYDSLMFRHFKVWFHLQVLLISFPVVALFTVLFVGRWGFVAAAVAQLSGAVCMAAFSHLLARRISPRPFRFLEKMAWTVAGLSLAVFAEAVRMNLFSKAGMAVLTLAPYVLFYWRRRGSLFPKIAESLRPEKIGWRCA